MDVIYNYLDLYMVEYFYNLNDLFIKLISKIL